MDWNLPTILVCTVLVIAIGAAVFAIFKSRKKPRSFCDGNCLSCSRKESK